MSAILRLLGAASLVALPTSTASAQSAAPDLQQLVATNSSAISFENGTLSGPGAEMLQRATANSQFVLLGEDHYQYHVPIFASALYRMLRSRHGFHHVVVEQDRLAVEDALLPQNRGNAAKLGAWARRYPGLFEFGSDQDLQFLADVGKLETGSTAICGAEQALGAPRYFDELSKLAPNAAVRRQVQTLRQRAMQLDPKPRYSVNFLIDVETPQQLDDLRKAFRAQPGSRADELLLALSKSAEIFGYFRRSEAGEPVGLYNNTVREEWIKRLFLRCYAKMQKQEALPKVMFKYGANHMYRGRNPTQAFPIGNLAHEFAIAHGMEAYGIYAQGLKSKAGYEDVPEWLRILLPATAPDKPLIVDLRALRAYQRIFREKLKPEDIEGFRTLVNGYDAILLLPDMRPAEMKLSGLEFPYH